MALDETSKDKDARSEESGLNPTSGGAAEGARVLRPLVKRPASAKPGASAQEAAAPAAPGQGAVKGPPASVAPVASVASAAGDQGQGSPGGGWAIPRAALKLDAEDPLLGCLALLAKLHERPQSPEALVSGLPMDDGRLTPELFLRAAERAGLTGRIAKRPLAGIPEFAFPVVLLLRDGGACVLVRGADQDSYEILTPESGGRQAIAADALTDAYSGYVIFVRPEYVDDDRLGAGALTAPKRSWFWGTVLQFWPTYSQVIVASLLINSFALVLPLFIMNVYDRVVPNNAIETLWVLAIGAATAIVFDFFMRLLRGYFVDSVGKRADTLLSAQIFEKVQDIQM
ncbi:MAG: cysteine peptidase family C39 domain-containing protein, partial [Alphaproteobacteria bacterium]